MTDSDADDVVNTQALTQQLAVSAVQADVDSMQYDDDAASTHDHHTDADTAAPQPDEAAADDEHDASDDDHRGTDNGRDDERDDDEQRDDQPAATHAPTSSDGKLKRPPSAYFLFCADKRADVKAELAVQSVTAVAKALGERWKQLTAEQKHAYEQTAKTAKAKYNQQQQLNHDSSKHDALSAAEPPLDPFTLVLPLAHIKRIVNKDPGHSRLTKQAALALSYAVQLFVLDMSRRCWLRVKGGKRRVVRMEEVLAVVEGGAGLDWLRGEMRRLAKEMDRLREADKKKRDEERERNKENVPTDPQPPIDSGKGSGEVVAEDADAEAEQAGKAAADGGKKKRKAGKAEIDPKQYKSLASMFSRMQEVQQQKQQHSTAEDEQRDEVEQIDVDEVEVEDSVQVDKRQKTTKRTELGVEELSDVEEEEAVNREEEEAVVDDVEVVTVTHRSKRRTAILDDDDDIDDV